MKTVLVVLRQANLNSLQVHESLSATMVLATFGCEVKVLLQDAALSHYNRNWLLIHLNMPLKWHPTWSIALSFTTSAQF